jgi:hypothetical protein
MQSKEARVGMADYRWRYKKDDDTIDLIDGDGIAVAWIFRDFVVGAVGITITEGSGDLYEARQAILRAFNYPDPDGWDLAVTKAVKEGWGILRKGDPNPSTPASAVTPSAGQVIAALRKHPDLLWGVAQGLKGVKVAGPMWDGRDGDVASIRYETWDLNEQLSR